MTAETTAPATWRELLSGDRLLRYALICAGTWLNAADTLMTATIMPSVARDIGGYAWFGWTVAGFLLGSILAGATAGRLSMRAGLRRALVLGGSTYALGCLISAIAPGIVVFLAGRMMQGVGGGWIAGLGYVAVTRLFPERLWTRALGGLSGIWGVATLMSPLIGGLFAQAGFWRGAFWLFGGQSLIYVAAVALLIERDRPRGTGETTPPPLLQVTVLGGGIVAVASAGLTASTALASLLGLAGLGLMALFLRIDRNAPSALLPRSAGDPGSPLGSGLAVVFCLSAASVSYTVYGPAMFQALHGASPVVAGYVLGCEAFAWTAAALLVASSHRAGAAIRVGAVLVTASIALLAFAVPRWGLIASAACGAGQGAGFGLCWSFIASRVTAVAGEGEQALASSSVPTTQMIGTAAGAAAAGAVANLFGFGAGITPERALTGGFWLFAGFAPLAILGCLAAWRFTREAAKA
ncbi:MFS transporter [Phenylobacterium montanum]|uniref:MFS transporter n=1 Tax=Phenylobacterium montanum TaxID=2823693 RepID=A0A975ISP3_9CAUL|nr:MFS transporter [Caulobacter sp. S6]QUD86012.1 MFS transporter [Caulobacter sp. S6]